MPGRVPEQIGGYDRQARGGGGRGHSRLEATGVIRHYKAIIDWEKAGRELVFAFIDVRVSPSRGVGYDDVARRIYRYPEVHSVYLVSGDYDLRVVVEGNTMRDVAFFVAEKLAPLEGVLSTRTNFLLKKYKSDGDHVRGLSPRMKGWL